MEALPELSRKCVDVAIALAQPPPRGDEAGAVSSRWRPLSEREVASSWVRAHAYPLSLASILICIQALYFPFVCA